MERSIAYIRVSELRQVTDGNSLASQERIVRDYAARRGYEFCGLWVEEGESAKTADRPVLQELLRELARQRVKAQVLIIPKIDRFARYVEDYTAIKAKLRRLNVRLESVGENLEDTPAGRFQEMVLASVAQFDNEIRAERCKGGMIDAVREGRWVWKAPIGYKNIRVGGAKKGGVGTIRPDPAEALLVRRAFERIASRDRQVDVRLWLESQGLKITPATLSTILRSKAYVGVIEAFGELNRAQPPFTPIISEALFYTVQTVLNSGKESRSYSRDNPEFALRGTVRCECGRLMSSCWSRGERERYPYYRCMSCQRVNVRREVIHQEFAKELQTFCPPETWIAERKAEVQLMWSLKQKERPNRLAEIDAALRNLDELSDSLAIQAAKGVVPEHVAQRQFQGIEVQVSELKCSRQKLQEAAFQVDDVVEFAGAFLRDLSFFWENSSLSAQKKLQAFLYPNGLAYTKDRSFRTPDYPFLESVKASFHTSVFSLVDPGTETPNELLEWFSSLSEAFNRPDGEDHV